MSERATKTGDFERDHRVAASPISRVLGRAVSRTKRYLRLRAGLRKALGDVPLLCAVAGVALSVNWVLGGPHALAIWVALGLVVLSLADFLLGFRRGPSSLDAALSLDRASLAQGQIAAGFDRTQLTNAQTPFDQLLLEQLGTTFGAALDAATKRPPDAVREGTKLGLRDILLPLVTLTAVSFLLGMKPRPTRDAPAPTATTEVKEEDESPALSVDEAAFLKREAQRLLDTAESEEGRDAARRLLALVEEASARGDQEGVLSKLAALREELADEGSSTFGRELERRGEALSEASATRALGEALKREDLEDAAEALETLAERLRNEKKPLSRKELDRLRKAIEKAQKEREKDAEKSSTSSEAGSDSRSALEEKRRRLLEKKQRGELSSAERQELERTERRLQQLDRKKKQQQETLSELDRALAQAAQEIQQLQEKAQGDKAKANGAAERFEDAARTASEEASRRLTDEEKKELLEQMERLKERLRQAEKDGSLKERMDEFQKRAHGRSGDSQDSSGGSPRSVPIPMPGQAAPSGASSNAPGEEGQPTQAKGTGKEAGASHDPNLTGEASERLDAEPKQAHAAAKDTGAGESESETILVAAQEGFTKSSYEKLYTDYHTVAEEQMDREQIPQGHKHQVERYFELIRPREGN